VTPATIVIDSRRSLTLVELGELWRARELLGFLAWRDVRVRYAQTFVGAAWALIEPFITVVAFTLIFNRLAGLESGDIPYPLYTFAAMLLWIFFGRSLRDVTKSCVANAAVVRKIYFPRLVMPVAALLASLIDLACAFVMYLLLMAYYGVAPTINLLALPLWIVLAGLTSLGIGLILSAVNVRFRDISQALPFLIQIWLLATPVAYPLASIQDKLSETWLRLYCLNPMVGVVEGMRWTLLPGQALDWTLLIPSLAIGLLSLFGGMLVFVRAQRDFADVI
jgi:lipopolysaccharide transport system permease protein